MTPHLTFYEQTRSQRSGCELRGVKAEKDRHSYRMRRLNAFTKALLILSTFSLTGAQDTSARAAPTSRHYVFVHAIGHGAWYWYEVVASLQALGYTATPLDMASHGTNDKTVADDVVTMAQYTKPLTDYLTTVTDKVILVGHSLGGGLISYAMEQYPEKIDKAVFVTACMPVTNQSSFSSFPPNVFPRLINNGYLIPNFGPSGTAAGPTSASLDVTKIGIFFYNKSPAEAIVLGQILISKTPYRPGNEVLILTTANYGSIRRFYIVADSDAAILPSEQQDIITANPPEAVFHIAGADHAVSLSKPDALVRYLNAIAKR